MIDLHSHVLPAVDDGPDDMDGALAMARAAVASGTRTLVATPHVSYGYAHVDAALVAERVAAVRSRLEADGVPLELLPGAEVTATRGADLPDDELRRLTLGDGGWLLLECPLQPGVGFDLLASSLQVRGHRLLLAHPERSPALATNLDALERLVGAGMLAQATAGSFAGHFGRTVQRAAFAMLERGLLHDIASDAHAASGPRGPALAAPLSEAGLPPEVVEAACETAPDAILRGERPERLPAWAPPRRRTRLLGRRRS